MSEHSTAEAAAAPGACPTTLVAVDDDALVLELLRHIIAELPNVCLVTFGHPDEALAWCRTNEPDVVITDFQMPGRSGIELIAALRREPHLADVPIMMITTSGDRSVRVQALDSGANDVLTKPIEAAEVRARTKNMLAIRQGQRLAAQRSSSLEEEVRRATAAIAARERETILRLSRAAEYRDWETGSHIVRVSLYARVIARRMALSSEEQETLFQAAPMHDVGKIGIPDAILLKPGILDESEFGLIQQHTIIGHEILGGSSAGLLQAAAEIALNHHERFDGTGYPHQVRGEDIPLRGRIVAVADTFDALTSHRPYKVAWAPARAWAFIGQHAGTRFDPQCVDAFLHGQADAEEIRAAFPDAQEGGDRRQRAAPSAAGAEGL